MAIGQIEWSNFRFDVSWSTSKAVYRRFSIARTTDGYATFDHVTGQRSHSTSLAAARAWAGIQVGERCVRHEPKPFWD